MGGQPIPLAVYHPVPAYRRQLVGALHAAGVAVEETEDLPRWVASGGPRVVVAALDTVHGVEVLRLHETRPEITIVALLARPTPEAFRAALRAGAAAAVPRSAPLDRVVHVVKAALCEHTLLPLSVVRAIVPRPANVCREAGVSTEEMRWLESLARGTPVMTLARDVGYSRSDMHRLLRRLYRKLGAESKEEALVRAAQWGLLG